MNFLPASSAYLLSFCPPTNGSMRTSSHATYKWRNQMYRQTHLHLLKKRANGILFFPLFCLFLFTIFAWCSKYNCTILLLLLMFSNFIIYFYFHSNLITLSISFHLLPVCLLSWKKNKFNYQSCFHKLFEIFTYMFSPGSESEREREKEFI